MQVALALMERPQERHWGYETSRHAGVTSGTLYPLLRRWLEQGWLTDGWENPAETEGRPPRRYYELTELGCQRMGALLAEAQNEPRYRPLVVGSRWWKPAQILRWIGAVR